MEAVTEPKTTEPVAIGGAVVVTVNSLLAILVGFEIVDWTEVQIGLIIGFVNNLVILAGVLFARGRVTPVHDPQDNSGNPMEVLPGYLEG